MFYVNSCEIFVSILETSAVFDLNYDIFVSYESNNQNLICLPIIIQN